MRSRSDQNTRRRFRMLLQYDCEINLSDHSEPQIFYTLFNDCKNLTYVLATQTRLSNLEATRVVVFEILQ